MDCVGQPHLLTFRPRLTLLYFERLIEQLSPCMRDEHLR